MPPEQLPDSIAPSCAGCARPDRRQFLASASVLSLGALATAACGDGVFSGPETIPAFPTASFSFDPRTVSALQQVGGRTVVQNGTTAPVLVERIGASRYRALSLACPHRGTIVEVSGDGFLCPNHGARFAADGTWLSGQATVDLAPVGVRLNADGTLTIGDDNANGGKIEKRFKFFWLYIIKFRICRVKNSVALFKNLRKRDEVSDLG
jgi:nitrite reductase/ring-hydroxylating ferredoxin subunit